jgi:hypothetical protein
MAVTQRNTGRLAVSKACVCVVACRPGAFDNDVERSMFDEKTDDLRPGVLLVAGVDVANRYNTSKNTISIMQLSLNIKAMSSTN